MKYIKKIFESSKLDPKVLREAQSKIWKIFFDKINPDDGGYYFDISVDSYSDDNIKLTIKRKHIGHPRDFLFRVQNIKDELLNVTKIGYDFHFHLLTINPYGNITSTHMDTNQLIDDTMRGDKTTELVVLFKFGMECSNPECDNILETSDEKCKVCGE